MPADTINIKLSRDVHAKLKELQLAQQLPSLNEVVTELLVHYRPNWAYLQTTQPRRE